MKLTIELVPSSSWFNNVRAVVTRAQWDSIRKRVYSAAYDTCQICGGVGKKHPVECQEIWNYDDNKLVQKLEGMIALCPSCHMVKHIGLAQLQDKGEQALKHLMKVNGLDRKRAEKYIADAFSTWAMRSGKSWKLDLSSLAEYGIDVGRISKTD